jgi:hypothetical protein
MRLRRRSVLAGLAGLVLALPWLLWAGCAMIGLLRGEHFHRGLPSSFWRRQLIGRGEELHSFPLIVHDIHPWLGTILVSLNLGGERPLLAAPGAVPVLAELMHDENPIVRHDAVVELGWIPGETAASLLREALTDPQPFVRDEAAGQLAARKNDAARAAAR